MFFSFQLNQAAIKRILIATISSVTESVWSQNEMDKFTKYFSSAGFSILIRCC